MRSDDLGWSAVSECGNFSVLGVVETGQWLLQVAPSLILLSTIAAICQKCKKSQNFDSLLQAHCLSYHFAILHDISYPICDFRSLKISPQNQFLGKNLWGRGIDGPPPGLSESLKGPSLKGLRTLHCNHQCYLSWLIFITIMIIDNNDNFLW